MTNRILTLCLFVLFAPVASWSQWWKVTTPEEIWLTQVGAAAHGAYLLHDANFQLPQAPMCCEPYQSSTAVSMSVSALIRQEITKFLRLNLRGTFMPMTGEFVKDQTIFVSGATEGLTRSTLTTSMSYIGGEILADFRIANPVRLMAGVSLGTLTGATFSQQEDLIVPGTGTFENGKRQRNVATGAEMQGVNTSQMGIVVGLGMDLPMTENHSVVITPELLYTIATADNITGQAWRTNSLRLGASIGFSLNAPEPPTPVERRREEFVDSVIVRIAADADEYRTRGPERIAIDTVVDPDLVVITERSYRTDTVFIPKAPVINAAIKARAVEASGATKDVFTINVSTQYVTEALPLLPAIFFESQSITISPRYHQIRVANDFDLKSVAPRTTAVHRDLLNILGERLAATQSMTLQLKGTADPTTENADCNLAQQRAIAVKDYLTRVWGIDAGRITVDASTGSCAPDRPTRRLSEEGYAENRRVEITSNDLSLLASVAKRRFNEARTVDPPRIQFDPTGTSTEYVT
ncbi:MAG: OmpA family protein, partial [Candidatus Kapaibacterium sp.]